MSNTKLEEAIKNIPPNWKKYRKNIRVNETDENGNSIGYYSLNISNTKAIFYFGACTVVHELLKLFVETDYPKTIETLYIGATNLTIGSYNYERIVEILEDTHFPNLREFALGDYDVTCNTGTYFYGKLGNVTKLLENMPKLEELELFGHFELDKVIDFPSLHTLYLHNESDYHGEEFSHISQQTLNNFLVANFPKLKNLELAFESDTTFIFPNEFLEGKRLPLLEILNIDGGFRKGEEERLLSSVLADSYNMTRIVSN